eukprot:scaffold37999_cov206-Amphora_coffeaeformis.AAC.1
MARSHHSASRSSSNHNSPQKNSNRSESIMSALVPQKRISTNDLSALTIDKLRWDLLKVQGRDREIQWLTQQLQAALVQVPQERDNDPAPEQQQSEQQQAENNLEEEQQPHQQQHRRLVLVSGPSGSGKSKLVDVTLQK